VVSRAHGPPWPRSWWRLLGVTSRSDAGSLPPPRPGRSRAATGRLRTPSCTTLTTTAADRQAGSGVSQRRRRSNSANAPGQHQQHERRQRSRPARTGGRQFQCRRISERPAVMPKRGHSPSATRAKATTCPGRVPVRQRGTAALSSEKPGGHRCPRCPPAFRQLGSRLSPGPRGGILAKCKPAGKRLQRWRFRLGLHTIPSRVCTRCHAQRRSETPLVRASSSGCAAHL
jgi:hypothetical protein